MKPILVLLAFVSFYSAQICAHPHSWIQMNTYVQGEQSTISGFYMEWEFDAMTSTYMLDGEPNINQETLQNLAKEVIDNMMSSHYFTYFYQRDNPIRYRKAIDAAMTYHRGKITLTFDLPLAKPITVLDEELKLLIFDPSYFVDMSWDTQQSIHLSHELNCSTRLKAPNPTPEQVAFALSLPIDADPDNELGQLFTETLYIRCENHAEL
ncbi:DUF1007 family protein [Vibrio makurazakiensis]|uniref:DUF1007 family protein n=1 Tax=Vibrio makurazakiensis TaxID=2910250 RepID=UPI003D0B7291